jgi:hypothetical protein
MALQADHRELIPAYRALSEAFGSVAHDYMPVLQYWSDGTHTVSEIGELAWLELGRPADEYTLAYFKLLVEAGLIELRHEKARHDAPRYEPRANTVRPGAA